MRTLRPDRPSRVIIFCNRAPVRELAADHQVKCHLSQEMLGRMEPEIKVAAE